MITESAYQEPLLNHTGIQES